MDRRWHAMLLAPISVVSAVSAVVADVDAAFADDYLTAEQARQIIFRGADVFEAVELTLTEAQRDQIKEIARVRQRDKLPRVWIAKKRGKPAGWFIVDEVVGKHEFITFSVGISAEGNVIGVEILSYRETHGGQVRDEAWRKRFVGKKLADPFKLDVDIPNISGATLSCRNLTDGVRRLLALHQVVLRAPAS